jgi:hypothetical protein
MTLRGLENDMYVEIRVRPVTRYLVTRFYSDEETGRGGSESLGEFDTESFAQEMAQALRLAPHLLKEQLDELEATPVPEEVANAILANSKAQS